MSDYDVEIISEKIHEGWMAMKRLHGFTSRKSEYGEELMVPYSQLSETAKDLDRGSVKAVLDAIAQLTAPPAPEGELRERIAAELRKHAYIPNAIPGIEDLFREERDKLLDKIIAGFIWMESKEHYEERINALRREQHK